MSRDYARTRESRKRGRPANNTKAKSNFTWLVVGVIMGIIIAGLSFLKHRVVSTVHPEKKYVVAEHPGDKSHKPKPILPKDDSKEEKVNFDFYTILPNMKVKGGKEAQIANTLKPLPESEKVDKRVTDTASEKPAPTVTPKALQNMEQSLLSPTNSTKVVDSPLKSVAQTPAKFTNKPAAKAEPVLTPKKPVEKTHLNKPTAHEPAKTTVHPQEKTGAPVVDLTAPKTKITTNAPTVNSAYIVQIAAFKRFEDADRLKAQLTLAGFEAKVKVVPVKGVNWNRVWLGPYPTAQAAEKVQQQLAAKHTKSVVVKVK